MKDAWGKKWVHEFGELDRIAQKLKLDIIVEYFKSHDDDKVKVRTAVKSNISDEMVIDIITHYPVQDDWILSEIISWNRNKKLDAIL
jgi:hypothetical protein